MIHYKGRVHYKNTSGPMISVNVHMPRGTYDLLKKISEERDLPVSRLVCMAVDNELDCVPQFNYQCEIPEDEYREFEYAEEAMKIMDYLMKFFQKPGTGLDTLMLCRRDMGIESRSRLLRGFRELLEKGLVKSFYPQTSKFRYAKTYRYYKPSDIALESDKRKKRKSYQELQDLTKKGPLTDANNNDEE